MGTLKPWEGGFVVLDGSGTQVLGSGGGDGGVGGGQSYYSEKFAAGTLPTTANGGGANNDTMMTDAIENDGGKEESEVVAALRAENLKLREQAEKAMAMAKQYGELNAELQREMLQR
jgi:hypothetical protein